MTSKPTTAHKIVIDGPPGSLKHQVWRCTCGNWESTVPDVGAYGHTTAKARIAQVNMAFGKHTKGVRVREAKAVAEVAKVATKSNH